MQAESQVREGGGQLDLEGDVQYSTSADVCAFTSLLLTATTTTPPFDDDDNHRIDLRQAPR